jgi:hypothetical protein
MLLAEDLAMALDPVQLAIRGGLKPDPWQETLLRSTSRRVLINASRQSGKSTTTAVMAVHTATYEPGSLVLLLSRALRQSGELFKKCISTYRSIAADVPAENETALTLTLGNGSRIVSLPGKEGNVRGFSGVDFLLFDEASRVPDELYFTCRPMLAVSGGVEHTVRDKGLFL